MKIKRMSEATYQKWLPKFNEARELIAQGMKVREAVKRVGLNSYTWFHMRKQFEDKVTPQENQVVTYKVLEEETPKKLGRRMKGLSSGKWSPTQLAEFLKASGLL